MGVRGSQRASAWAGGQGTCLLPATQRQSSARLVVVFGEVHGTSKQSAALLLHKSPDIVQVIALSPARA